MGGNTSFDFNVLGIIEPRQQISKNVCWATVATMMVSWKDQQSLSIEDVMNRAGSKYLQMFQQNQLLDLVDELPSLLNALSMVGEPPQNIDINSYLSFLQSAGPLWLWSSETASNPNVMHARILTGMFGDGTDIGTIFRLIDPGNGQKGEEFFIEFITKFEAEVGSNGTPIIQIIHF